MQITNPEKSVSFTQAELKKFVQQISDMVKAQEKIDIPKAIHHAKYLAELDRRLNAMKAGHYVELNDAEWEYFYKEAERLDNSCPEKMFDADTVLAKARLFAMFDDYEQKKKRGELPFDE